MSRLVNWSIIREDKCLKRRSKKRRWNISRIKSNGRPGLVTDNAIESLSHEKIGQGDIVIEFSSRRPNNAIQGDTGQHLRVRVRLQGSRRKKVERHWKKNWVFEKNKLESVSQSYAKFLLALHIWATRCLAASLMVSTQQLSVFLFTTSNLNNHPTGRGIIWSITLQLIFLLHGRPIWEPSTSNCTLLETLCTHRRVECCAAQ